MDLRTRVARRGPHHRVKMFIMKSFARVNASPPIPWRKRKDGYANCDAESDVQDDHAVPSGLIPYSICRMSCR